MHSKHFKPLITSLGLGLLTACPTNPEVSTEGSTGSESEGTTDDTSDPTTNTPTSNPPTTSDTDPEPTTTGDTTTGDTTTDDTTTGSTTDTTTGEPGALCDHLGGTRGIGELVSAFVGGVLVDEKINGYFLNADVDGADLIAKVSEQLGAVAGCEGVEYTGKSMKEAHAGLKISSQDFMDFVADFQVALDVHAEVNPDLTEDDKAAVLGVLAGLEGDIVEDPDDNATVYQRVGRKPAIKGLIGGPDDPDSFIGLVLADAAINSFFVMADPLRLNTCLTRQVGGIDGPIKYGLEVNSPAPGIDEGVSIDNPCRDMVSSHMNLQDAEMTFITFDDFAALVGDLITAMTNFNVPDGDQMAILGVLGSLCDQIVVGGAEQNKCPGNNKLETVEAAALAAPLLDDMYDGTIETMICTELAIEEDVDGIGFVGDVQLRLGLDHTWAGDVTVKVVSPAGTLLTVLQRPGNVALNDDGKGCCNDDSDFSKDFPILFKDGGENDAAKMGTTIGASKIICKDDLMCEFKPAPGKGPGLDFTDFLGEPAVGTWKVCVGDSNLKDFGTLDYVGLDFTKVKFDPKL